MIRVLKLISGEEVVADVTEGGSTYYLEKPCYLQVVPSRTDPQQTMMALIPYASFTKGHKIGVKKEAIVWIEEAVDELYNQYNSVFGSGLVVPNSKIA